MTARLAFGCCAWLGLVGPASNAAELPATLRACSDVVDSSQRLACFDREIARAAKPAAAASASAMPEVSLTPEQKLGLSNARVQKLEDRTPTAAPAVHAHVVTVSQSADGAQTFVLDNTQVWGQSERKSDFVVRPGASVTIEGGALGSFWMSTDRHHSTRVRRIR